MGQCVRLTHAIPPTLTQCSTWPPSFHVRQDALLDAVGELGVENLCPFSSNFVELCAKRRLLIPDRFLIALQLLISLRKADALVALSLATSQLKPSLVDS